MEIINDQNIEKKQEVNYEEIVENHLKEIKCINKVGISENCCEYFCCKKKSEDSDDRNRFYDDAKDMIDYYRDISVYTQKMIEVDIIKYLLFNKNERNVIKLLSNPELFFGVKEKIKYNLDEKYNIDFVNTEDIDIKMCLKSVVEKSKIRGESKKMLKLIRTGIQKAMFIQK